ncbi:MAG: NADP-dependent malic enzyme [Candidatus Omnitrophica bacterium]|nr:NADP-dependent malic enzyme [Candidatus Omnitrophota bacterium]MCM8828446.1 NADP-dependent malic enzyme [Candidatus Omnitrophota bacterium]
MIKIPTDKILKSHIKGKLGISIKAPLKTRQDLSIAYTPGVAEVCKLVEKTPSLAYDYTIKGNSVAVVTDGSAVLGLGDIGPEAAMPVMEGKAILFKEFGGVDAYPVCLSTKNAKKIIEIVCAIAPGFGGINLEDISSPRCFIIEKALKKRLKIPVFHDDQHGTAIVVLAAIINSLKLAKKKASSVKAVINGAGAAGVAVTRILRRYGIKTILLCDRNGIICKSRKKGMNYAKIEILKYLAESPCGTLSDALQDADIFIGLSGPNLVTPEMIKRMKPNPIVFAMANPVPEIMPEEARKAGAFIIGTGRSDYPNQINNLLAFPGIFRGVLDARAKQITEKMKIEAAKAIAAIIPEKKLCPDYVIPSPFNKAVAKAVAGAVKKVALSK